MINIEEVRQQAMFDHSRGKLEQAASGYSVVLQAKPDDEQVLFLNGLLAGQRSDFDNAVKLLQRAARLNPKNFEYQLNLGRAFRASGRHQEALDALSAAQTANPAEAAPALLRSACLVDLGRDTEALTTLNALTDQYPRLAEAWLEKGNIQAACGDLQDALSSFQRARSSNPTVAAHHLHEGQAFLALGRAQEARESFDRAVQIDNNLVAAHLGRAQAMLRLHNVVAAMLSADKARQLAPESGQAYFLLGCGQAELGHLDESLNFLEEALSRDSSSIEALFAKGEVLQKLKRHQDAAKCFDQVTKLSKKIPMALGHLLEAKMASADWEDFAQLSREVTTNVANGVVSITPVSLLNFCDDPNLIRAHACQTAHVFFPRATRSLGARRAKSDDILRVGFLGSDFASTVRGSLLLSVWECRDKTRTQFTLIDSGLQETSKLRERIDAAFDKTLMVTDLSDSEAATRIAALQLDVLVNLGGYYAHARPGIFAMRPCVTQISFGYPATMGSDYFDYVIVDEKQPVELTNSYFTEQPLPIAGANRIPHTLAQEADSLATRESFGLPALGVIFACLQPTSRITPEVFACWMRVLDAVQNSSLWLSESTEQSAANLRQTALKFGISESRLIFTEESHPQDYFAKLRLADLVLDTYPWGNADALFVGTPTLTIEGNSAHSKITAEALRSLSRSDLITANLDDYAQKAIDIGRNPDSLASIRESLKAANHVNTKTIAEKFEAALRMVSVIDSPSSTSK